MWTGCIEVCGKAQVELALKSEGFDTALSGLKPLAKMDTVRRKWKVGDFTLSVDDSLLLLGGHGAAEGKVVKIPHSVGEVELCEEVDEKDTVSKMKEMTKEIDDFVGRYDEVFQGRHNGLCQRSPRASWLLSSGGSRYCGRSGFFQIQDGVMRSVASCQSHRWACRQVRKSRDFSTNV